MKVILSISILLSSYIFADDEAMQALTKELNIYPGSKATIQWNRIFSSQRHLKRYNLNTISKKRRDELQLYLIKHAADSQQPIVPGL
jgi:hypothetical protein